MRRFLAPALLAALLLAACGGAAAPTPSTPLATPADEPAAGGPVTIGFAAQEYARQLYEPLIERFEQENPGIRVQFVPVDDLLREMSPSGQPTQINRRIVSAADTAAPFFVQAEDIAAGHFADLRPLIDADPAFDPADFQPGALEAFTVDGGVYAVPQTINVALLSYNRDLFAARGVAEPELDMTWSELLALAEQLGEVRGGSVETYGYVDWSSGSIPLLGLLAEEGLNLFAAPAGQVRLDDPRVEAAVARVAALVGSGALSGPAEDGSGNPGDFQQAINEGRVAMWPDQMLFTGPGAPQLGFEVGVVPLPHTELPLFGLGQSYVMSAGTQYPEQAWRWLSFLSRQEVRQPFDPGGAAAVPARRSIADASGYWAGLDETTAAAVRAALERTTTLPSLGAFDGRVFDALSKALAAATGGESAQAALREAQATLDEQQAQAAATPSPTPDSGPIVVTLPDVPVALEGATQITFAVTGMDPAAMRQLATEYNRQRPDLFVNVESAMGPDQPSTFAGIAERVDCFTWYGPPPTDELTATLDLQPLVEADASGVAEDYPPALLDQFRHEGGLFGLPYIVTLRTLAYNRDMFAEAGLEPPTSAWTIEDMLQAARQLSGGDGQARRYGFGTLGPHGEDLVYFVGRAGGSLTTGSGESLAPNYTDPKVFQGVSVYLDLLRDASPHERIQGYEANSSWGGDVFQLMSEGRLGMWFDRGVVRPFAFGAPDGQAPDIGVVAPPGLETLRPGDFSPETALFISASTEQAQACWEWITHVSGDTSQMQYGFPARVSAAESEAFASSAPAGATEVYRAYRDAMGRTPRDQLETPRQVAGPVIEHYWFYRAADRALQGEDLERELAEAQRLAEEHLLCVRGGGEAGECALQLDPEYNGYLRPQR